MLLDHVTFLLVASAGLTVAINVSVLPTTIVSSALFRLTDIACITGLFTVTLQVAVFFPSTVVTVISAVPALTAVTFPVESTEATEALLLDHVTCLLQASDGFIVAINVSASPTVKASSVLFKLTDVTLLCALLRMAFTSLSAISACPAFEG